MTLSTDIIDSILGSESKALATHGSGGVNVVPVSTLYIVDGSIWLMHYFFKKTFDNIMHDPRVALVCWKGSSGYQVKGTVSYHTDGPLFEKAVHMVSEHLPDRIVKGLLVLSPEECYDISPKA